MNKKDMKPSENSSKISITHIDMAESEMFSVLRSSASSNARSSLLQKN